MAKESGAKSFGLGSLVHLRCGGKDSDSLSTKPAKGEAVYYFSSFPEPLLDGDRQEKMARTLDVLSRRLSKDNREDLLHSQTTLTADGTLGAPSSPLWVVESSISSVALVPQADQLHPRLHKYRAVAGLCKTFDIVSWVRGVALKAQGGEVGDEERESLYRYVVERHGKFDRKTTSILRRSPILKDHHGRWVAPTSIIGRRVAGASSLEPVLHFPNADYYSDTQMGRALGFRRKVNGEDFGELRQACREHPRSSRGV